MIKRTTLLLHIILVFIAISLDGSIALYASPIIFRNNIEATPLLVLLVIITPIIGNVQNKMTIKNIYYISLIAGLIYDIYYNGIIGIATILFPISIWISMTIKKYFKTNTLTALLIWIIVISFYQLFSYLEAITINLTDLSFTFFIINRLLPSIIINVIIFIIMYKLLIYLYKKTIKEDPYLQIEEKIKLKYKQNK